MKKDRDVFSSKRMPIFLVSRIHAWNESRSGSMAIPGVQGTHKQYWYREERFNYRYMMSFMPVWPFCEVAAVVRVVLRYLLAVEKSIHAKNKIKHWRFLAHLSREPRPLAKDS